eukprot:1455868-Pyramimonas_sp.AAC.1
MPGTALVVNQSTTLGAAKHCDDVAKGIPDAWSQSHAAEAFFGFTPSRCGVPPQAHGFKDCPSSRICMLSR